MTKHDETPRPLGSTDLKRLHRGWHRRTEGRLAVLLDGVMTPYNVGSIVRLAAAYDVEQLLLAGATVSVTHPGARKTAMGTDRYLDVRTYPAAIDAIADLKADGFEVVGVELAQGAIPLFELSLPSSLCLVFGHEDHGLSKACLTACDRLAYLPLSGRVGSLNVATAAGIALYEARRQEWTKG
jgi:tRNA (guanosine-2'-O-)-methyltransferase